MNLSWVISNKSVWKQSNSEQDKSWKISDSHMNDWVQSWKGIPMLTGEELLV